MKALVLTPGEDPSLVDVENDIGAFQTIIGGYVENIPTSHADVCVLADEEGLMKRLPTNYAIASMFGMRLVGTVVIVGDGGEEWTDVPPAFLNRMDLWPFPGETS